MKKLKTAVARERLFVKDVSIGTNLNRDFSGHKQDPISNFILSDYHCDSKSALFSRGDGNCLFNSISIVLAGDESMSTELRYRCCIEMVTNKSKVLHHRMYSRLEPLSPDYDEDCINCAEPGKWSSAWMMIAVSNLLNLPVKSVFPAVNSTRNPVFKTLNCLFRPPFSDPAKGEITIMWTNTTPPQKNSFSRVVKAGDWWSPNHFVPLVDVPMKEKYKSQEKQVPQLGHDIRFTNKKNFLKQESSIKMSGATISHATMKMKEINSTQTVTKENCKIQKGNNPVEEKKLSDRKRTHTKVVPNFEQNLTSHENISLSPSSLHEDSEVLVTDVMELDNIQSNAFQNTQHLEDTAGDQGFMTTGDTDITDNLEPTDERFQYDDLFMTCLMSREGSTSPKPVSSDEEEVDQVQGLLGNKFMDTRKVLELLQNPHTPLSEIPTGRKDAVYFFIDNSYNVERRKQKQHCQFWDDRGAWKKAACPVTLFTTVSNKLTSVKLHNDEYVTEKRIDKKKQYIPLVPQPQKQDVLEVHRLYQNLEASPAGPYQYRRRVTWLENIPPYMQDLPDKTAIIEYIGDFPKRKCHGNSKDEERCCKYVRTKPQVAKTLKTLLLQDSVKNVERKMNMEVDNDYDKQRNEKQLRNIRHAINKNQGSTAGTNAADNIIKVEELVKNSTFVKSVKHMEGLHHPVVTLYTAQQITDIKRFCCRENGTVLSIDKTYNLGEFFVTPTVYKDLSVVRRTPLTGHPICIGPTFIHTNSTAKTYSSFFHDIADNLSDQEISLLTIGTDEEPAFKNAIRRCFNGATHVLCTRHLKQNANRYMEDEVGIPSRDRQELLNKIFGRDGLIDSKDIDVQNFRLSYIHDFIDKIDNSSSEKTFRKYFDDRLYPLIHSNVIGPVRRGKINANWTNNNSESANHVLKAAASWKARDLPSFIDMWKKIIEGEAFERERAVRGAGNFKLSVPYRHHLTDIDHWSAISQNQRDQRLKRFHTDRGRANLLEVISSDGTRSCLSTPTAGKKDNQRKRKRAERSRTPAKRMLLIP